MTIYFAKGYTDYYEGGQFTPTEFFSSLQEAKDFLFSNFFKSFGDYFENIFEEIEDIESENIRKMLMANYPRDLSDGIREIHYQIIEITDQSGKLLAKKERKKTFLDLAELQLNCYNNYINSKSVDLLFQDLENFYRKQEFTDFELVGKKVHKLLLEKRTKMKATEIRQRLEENKEQFDEQDLETFLSWVYFFGFKYISKGKWTFSSKEKKEQQKAYLGSLFKVLQILKIDFGKEEIKDDVTLDGRFKSEYKKFFTDLMNDEETKDMAIRISNSPENGISGKTKDTKISNSEQKEIVKEQTQNNEEETQDKPKEKQKEEKASLKKVHLLMLLIRSGLYRNLNASVKNLEHTITDYSCRSKKFWEFFLHWIYTGEIKRELLTKEVIKEMKGAQDYFQLNDKPYPIIKCLSIIETFYLENQEKENTKKIHGSLTRAGKVRNQTPKVEKLPKKKKLTGRAKMRFLYNKRFVHVVEEQGRRRAGPNSNKNK
ncbi:40S ribosomal protein S30/UBIQUITIN-LIKE PROTEIN FUBI [Anaeramoeba flamelloides]|uniref:40S ribosomal protein S30/UBIQUITIN-LIKE PROTEIN FUBI n=1 Tax=Anaeramoeba flamelloides TaxID=1746091 RepID=A0AAV7ZCS7_9EUKA|nr:40S ribosomal protein S30/UBIQUITIN-LIKE PROTEIN FUBI [Anaeramoeba flamelloides]